MDFPTMLRDHNMKVTPQRLEILISLEYRGHANVEQIHSDLQKSNPAMSLTTIYRNINEMMKNALVLEVKLPNQKQKYEIIKKPHIHLSCDHCGSVMDAFIDTKAIFSSVEANFDCNIIDDAIVLNVLCKDCKNNN